MYLKELKITLSEKYLEQCLETGAIGVRFDEEFKKDLMRQAGVDGVILSVEVLEYNTQSWPYTMRLKVSFALIEPI